MVSRLSSTHSRSLRPRALWAGGAVVGVALAQLPSPAVMGIPIPAVGVAPAVAIVMAAGVAPTMAATTVAADIMEEGSIRAWRTRPGTHPAFIIRSRTISEVTEWDS